LRQGRRWERIGSLTIASITFGVSTIERSSLWTRLGSHSSIRIRIPITDTIRTITTVTMEVTMSGMAMPRPELLKCSVYLRAPVITMVVSMGSWGRKRDEQFALTSAITICPRTVPSIGSFSERHCRVKIKACHKFRRQDRANGKPLHDTLKIWSAGLDLQKRLCEAHPEMPDLSRIGKRTSGNRYSQSLIRSV